MTMRWNKILIIWPIAFMASAYGADAPSGCLVKTKNKVLFDPQCKCLEKKLCASPTKIVYKDSNFSQKNVDGKFLYSDKEKKIHKDSYESYNKIMELKSQGKGDSEEIKEHYMKLAKLNAEVFESYKKNHPDTHKLIVNANERAKKRISEKQAKRMKGMPTIDTNSLAEASPTKIEEGKKIVVPTAQVVRSEASSSPASVSNPVIGREQLSNEDKKHILKNIKYSDKERNNEDSIFDIISKKYVNRAYKDLLAPNED